VISFFNLGAWAGLYTYTPELYPTRMRGSGSGVAASLGRFAGIFAPTVTPLLWVSADSGYPLSSSLWLTVCRLVCRRPWDRDEGKSSGGNNGVAHVARAIR